MGMSLSHAIIQMYSLNKSIKNKENKREINKSSNDTNIKSKKIINVDDNIK